MALSLEDMVNKLLKCLGPELEEKTNTLQRKIELLTSRKDDTLIDLQQEAYSDGKKRKREVEDWLINVEDIITEFETLKQKIQCCKFYARQNLTQQVEIMTKEVTELLEQSDFPKGLFLENRPSRCLLALLKILEEDEISRIGILGLGRLGKTTLSNELSNESTFLDHVYRVRVSQGSSIYKLQNDIVEALKLDFSGENDERERANKLSEAFKRRGRYLLILDDVWKQIDVEKIGIPVGINGCKLIITSRSKKVCHQMHCQRIIIVNSVRIMKVGQATKVAEEMEYPCNMEGCSMSFGSKQELALDQQSICPVKPCGKKFFSRKYRTEHKKVHTGAHRHLCSEPGCDKTFRFASAFSRHRNKHKAGHSLKKSQG